MRFRYDSARDLRGRSSDAEKLLWQRLRNSQPLNCKFRRQQPIGPYIADFVCLDRRLVTETDGGRHAERLLQDEARTAFLQVEGYRVLRFWNNQVFKELESVLEVIYAALADSAHPSPNPLPQGERALTSTDRQ